MKIAIPLLLIVAGLAGLIVMGIARGGVPELQVSQVLAGAHEGARVKMHGTIGEIASGERPLRFTVADKADPSKTVEVHADRTRPDTFQEAYDVAVLGRYDAASGRFTAEQIYTKCPSKYEADEERGIGSPRAKAEAEQGAATTPASDPGR